MKQTIKIFSETNKVEKIIISDLLNDIIYFDVNNKKPVPNTLAFKRFENNNKEKIVKILYNEAKKEVGEKNVIQNLKLFLKKIYDFHFWEQNEEEFPNVAHIPLYKIKGFSKDLETLISKWLVTFSSIYVTRKLWIQFLLEWNLILKSKNKPQSGYLHELIQEMDWNQWGKTMMWKLMYELISEIKEIYWQDIYKNWLEEINWIEEKVELCAFNKKSIQYVYDSIKSIWNNLTYSINKNIFLYNGEEIKPFKTQKNKINLRVELCKLMYTHEKGQQVNFKEMLPFYIEDDYYSNTITKPIINKIIKLISKVNTIIKEKTQNSGIKLFSQETIDWEHYIIRNI